METQQSDLNTDATKVRGSETPQMETQQRDATKVRGSETPQTLPLGSKKTCF
jgi:hypothetical protein